MQVSALDPGEGVDVHPLQGPRIRGKVVHVDAESITVRRDGRDLRLAAADVYSIERRDRVWDGGQWGFAIGFATGALMMATCDGGLFCERSAPAILLCGTFAGGFGAGVGILADALVRGDRTVFRRTDATRVDIAPAIGARHKAVMVRVSF